MKEPKLIVGVGASASGLDAFKQLLSSLPEDTGMAFLLVQPRDSTHESMLAELLAPHTSMEVRDADDGLEVAANTVYVTRSDSALAVSNGVIRLSEPNPSREIRLPVDHMFRSLAREYGARAVGVVLLGAGSDGTTGLREIVRVGGLAIAQDPASSTQWGMPQSAVYHDAADVVLQIEDMPAALERFSRIPEHVRLDGAGDAALEAEEEDTKRGEASESLLRDHQQLEQLASLLEVQLGFNLRVYKPATIHRRISRRMALTGFDELALYVQHIRESKLEQQALLQDLLISVTEFFRNPESFAALRRDVIEPLVRQAQDDTVLRCWVPACATGEEAYSVAIEVLEATQAQDRRLALQLFATDIDSEALAAARAGIYPLAIAERMSEARLRAFFKLLDGRGYEVKPFLRDVVSFAEHDLTRDPPFSRMHLVTCRNVLIYLTGEAQSHVLRALIFALQRDGHLFLGNSESMGRLREHFKTVSKSHRIYKKVGASRPARYGFWPMEGRLSTALNSGQKVEKSMKRRESADSSRSDLARRSVLKALVPPTVIVTPDGAIPFMHGELGPFLRFPEGDDPRLEFQKLIRPEYANRARGALHKCRRTARVVRLDVVAEGTAGRCVRICAHPVPDLGDGVVMLTFEALAEAEHRPAGVVQKAGDVSVVQQLERELEATREDLHSTVEELETSNEKLRSANEESMSMNEELQSANEELEATTEELRSLNEELTTVNGQLSEKIDLLLHAHDDLNNFFGSTQIATVFLDEHLAIKRFTPAAEKLLGLAHSDEGRSIVDFARELLQNDLEAEACRVLADFAPREREIYTAQGTWIARHVLPYRTEGRRIEGVVVTFVDVTQLKLTAEKLEVREHQQAVIGRLGHHALREPDLQSFLEILVREVQQTLNSDYCKVLELQPDCATLLLRAGVGWRPGLVGKGYVDAGSDSQAGYTLESQEPVIVQDLASERRFSGPPLLVEHGVVSGLSCVIGHGDRPYGVIGVHTKTYREFDDDDARFLEAVAGIAAATISRDQSRMRQALELIVANVVAEAKTLDAALEVLIARLTETLGASVSEYWAWNGAESRYVREHLYISDKLQSKRIREGLPADPFTRDEGLQGRVGMFGKAIWCTDLSSDDVFVRRQFAVALGLSSGVAFPVISSGELVGAVTIFSGPRLFTDETTLAAFESIGRAFGDFIARADLERRAAQLAAITETSQDAILSYDHEHRVTTLLSGAVNLFGFTEESIVGASILQIVPEQRRNEFFDVTSRVQAGQKVEPFETRRLHEAGHEIDVSVRASAVKDQEGKIIGVTTTERDITRLKATELRLRDADRQKDEFLAMLGHELRNPLAAIRTASNILERECAEDSKLRDTLAVMHRQIDHVSRLLDGLLDVARIGRGQITLSMEVLELRQLCREVVKDAADRAKNNAVELTLDLDPDPIYVNGDRGRLIQIVDNLVTNALKFTDEGRIQVSVKRDGGSAVMSVTDTGIGIDESLLPNVFKIFCQSERSLDRSEGGLGLGLTLVKTLTELHGGRVDVRSEGPGQGAEFRVWIPTTEGATSPSQGAAKVRSQGACRFLLIEDHLDSAEPMRRLLTSLGHTVDLAHDGPTGIELAREARFDVVLCDVGLPGGTSGFDVAEILRAMEGTRDLHLIALTGYGTAEDKARCLAAGFDAHLTKPVEVNVLLAAIEDVPRSADVNREEDPRRP
ncbi:MAG: CheR family methyltransferase [Planctomycetota bacterium]